MKKLYKRVLSGILCLTCVISLCPSVLAVETTQYSNTQLAEIEAEREALYDFLEMQLAAQDALEYIDEFTYLVDMTINSKYSLSTYAQSSVRVYAPDGGFVYGNDLYYTREAEFMNTEATAAALENQDEPLDILFTALAEYGYGEYWDALKSEFIAIDPEDLLPGITQIGLLIDTAELCMLLNDISLAVMWQNVEGSGCVVSELYDKVESRVVKVIWPWGAEPYIDLGIFPSDEDLVYEVLTQ